MNNCIVLQGSPHLVKNGWHDSSVNLLNGKMRGNLGDFRISCKDLNVSFPVATCSLFFTKKKPASQQSYKKMQSIIFE